MSTATENEPLTFHLPQQVPITFQRIAACSNGFLMGSRYGAFNERPVHRVVIPYDYWLSTTPITWQQFNCWTSSSAYQNWLEKDPSLSRWSADNEGPNKPAGNVDWYRAAGFCEWLQSTLQSPLQEKRLHARLPYEVEWEYACNAGRETAYHTGDGESALKKAGWYSGNLQKEREDVGKKQANFFGLHDLHGNVWEWCLDRWDENAYRRRWDRIMAKEAYDLSEQHGDQEQRVLRGGSRHIDAGFCRAAFRSGGHAGGNNRYSGLRACLAPSPDQSGTSDA
jgi:formylglycine-generating enzyme required for sulfatase activity